VFGKDAVPPEQVRRLLQDLYEETSAQQASGGKSFNEPVEPVFESGSITIQAISEPVEPVYSEDVDSSISTE